MNRNEKFEDRIERFALADVYSWQANNVIVVILINIILVASIVGLYKYLNRYSRHSKKELIRLFYSTVLFHLFQKMLKISRSRKHTK